MNMLTAVNQSSATERMRAYRAYWHPIALTSEIQDKPVKQKLCGEDLVVWRAGDDSIVVQQDRCVHRGAALSLGRLVDGCIEAPYHAWTYDKTGACVFIPAMGKDWTPPAEWRVKTYPVRIEGGMVWTCLESPKAEFPEWPSHMPWGKEGTRSWVLVTMDWNTGASRVVENLLDVSHFATVHDGSFGVREDSVVPNFDVNVDGDQMKFRWIQDTPKDPKKNGSGSMRLVLDYTYHVPFAVHIHQQRDDGTQMVISSFAQPYDDENSRMFIVAMRDYDIDADADQKLIDYFWPIVDEDRVAGETLSPKYVPANSDNEVHLPVVDAPGVEFRKFLKRIEGV